MVRLSSSLIRVLAIALLSSVAFADIVVLKTGEKIEGKIVREDAQQLVLEVKVSATISDEKTILKAQVERIDKVLPETEAYRAIINIQPLNNSLASVQYEQPILTLQNYLKQFPTGLHSDDAQKTLNEFIAEKKRVDAGEVKLQGQWLNKVEAEREKVQIGGINLLDYMKAQAAAGDNIGALNTFLLLEKNYPGAASMPDAIDFAKQLAAQVDKRLERAVPEQKILKAQKEQGFKEASPADRVEMQTAYKKEMDAAEAASDKAEKAGLWPPLIITNEKALKTLQSRTDKETTRMAALPVDSMRKSIQLAAAARKSVDAEDYAAATDTLKEATTLWPKNELALRLTKVIADQKAASARVVTATGKPGTPGPGSKTSGPGSTTLAAATTPAKAGATPKPKSTPKSTPVGGAAPAAAAPPEDDKPFLLSLPGAITVVVAIAVVLAGLNVFKKMKARKAAEEIS